MRRSASRREIERSSSRADAHSGARVSASHFSLRARALNLAVSGGQDDVQQARDGESRVAQLRARLVLRSRRERGDGGLRGSARDGSAQAVPARDRDDRAERHPEEHLEDRGRGGVRTRVFGPASGNAARGERRVARVSFAGRPTVTAVSSTPSTALRTARASMETVGMPGGGAMRSAGRAEDEATRDASLGTTERGVVRLSCPVVVLEFRWKATKPRRAMSTFRLPRDERAPRQVGASERTAPPASTRRGGRGGGAMAPDPAMLPRTRPPPTPPASAGP